MKCHKDLKVYKDSILLVTSIYQVTNEFPKSELFGLTSQIRRSAVSIPSNIAEGSARYYQKELIRFLRIALGSASELDAQLEISLNLNFLNRDHYTDLVDQLNSICRMLQGLLKSIKD